MNTQTYLGTLDIERCIACGTTFGVESTLLKHCLSEGDKKNFYCPNGHSMCYRENAETRLLRDLEKKNRELEEKSKRITELSCEVISQRDGKYQERAQKKRFITILSKHKQRSKGGVCPCCHRQFPDMLRHMTTKHPHYSGKVE